MERFKECLGFKKPGAQASCRPVPYNFLSARRRAGGRAVLLAVAESVLIRQGGGGG